MENRLLLSLDMSTTCTGWSLFDIEQDKLLSYGTIKPATKISGLTVGNLKYPRQQLLKMIDISFKIRNLIENLKPNLIVIEEIAGSKNRLGQKVLDGLHWVVLIHIQEYIDLIHFYDVSGADGWRTHLQLKLDDADKLANKEAKKVNPTLGKGVSKLPTYDAKDLACRYANRQYGLTLDPQTSQTDNDIGDSVSLGSAFIKFKCPKL